MNNGYNNTTAMLLNSTNYGESDKIVTFYTSDYGKIRGIAKGARRSRRRFVNKLEPFLDIYLTFFYHKNRDLVRIEECRTRRDFRNIKTDIERLSYGSYLLELLDVMTGEEEQNKGLFELMLTAFEMLEEGDDVEKTLIFFEIKLLKALGYRPHLEDCLVCKRGRKEVRYYFSSRKGGIICEQCKDKGYSLIPISLGTARFLSTASRMDLCKLKRLIPNQVVIKEAQSLLKDFIYQYTGRELKTRQFIKRMVEGSCGATAPNLY